MLTTVTIIIVHMIRLMIGNTSIVTIIGLMQDKDSVFGTNVRIIFFPSVSYYFHIPKIFLNFFLTLEKIGIDEKVICYHNISN